MTIEIAIKGKADTSRKRKNSKNLTDADLQNSITQQVNPILNITPGELRTFKKRYL
jgi:hypothetical protein